MALTPRRTAHPRVRGSHLPLRRDHVHQLGERPWFLTRAAAHPLASAHQPGTTIRMNPDDTPADDRPPDDTRADDTPPRDSHAVELQKFNTAVRAGVPFLVWRARDGRQQLLTLHPDPWRVLIGRDNPGVDVSLDGDLEVSRTHALLERLAGNGWMLIDNGLSRNGSFVNGKKVDGSCHLANEDRIGLGATELKYHDPTPRDSESTVTHVNTRRSMQLPPMRKKVLIALCRPVHEKKSQAPATNLAIAAEVFLGVNAVKDHLRRLFELYGISDLPQNEKRARLAALAIAFGDVTARDF